MNESPIQPVPEEQLPEPIAAALRSRYGPTPDIPAAVDDAVRQDAFRHLKSLDSGPAVERTSTFRTGWQQRKWVAGSIGSLIAVALLIAVWPRNPRSSRLADGRAEVALSAASEPAPAMSVGGGSAGRSEDLVADLDDNGRIDILDAFALARSIQSGDDRPEVPDLNNDGQRDQRDVDLIAMTAVTL